MYLQFDIKYVKLIFDNDFSGTALSCHLAFFANIKFSRLCENCKTEINPQEPPSLPLSKLKRYVTRLATWQCGELIKGR